MRDEEFHDEKRRTAESIFNSFGQTINGTIANLREILRSEIELAKTEIKEALRRVAKAVVFYAVAAILALFGLGFILLACVYALAYLVQPWLAALIVGVAVAAISGGALIVARKHTQRVSFRMEQTIETVKENVRWAKNRFR